MRMSIDEARIAQPNYQPNAETAAKLQKVAALLFVGPAGVGKSTILNSVAEQDGRFKRTGSIGSRPAMPRDDPNMFKHVEKDKLLEQITDRDVVQYAIHPTTESIYATTAEMYRSPYNMLESMPATVEQMRHVGFGGLQVFSMVTEPEAWRQWFVARYPDQTDERDKRRDEAIMNLQWSLDQPEGTFVWLNNTAGEPEKTAQQIIHTATTSEPTGDYRHLAEGMLNEAEKL